MTTDTRPTPEQELLRECLRALNDKPGFTYHGQGGPRCRSYALAAAIEAALRAGGLDPYKPEQWS